MGTATLEAKLAQQLARLAYEPLFQVFLYIRKSYDSLDMGQYMEILWEYGMGPNMACLLLYYWDNQQIVPKAGMFLGKSFGTGRGVMQGNPVYPIIFNILVDATVREILLEVCGPQEAEHGLVWAARERDLFFYADDGRIA